MLSIHGPKSRVVWMEAILLRSRQAAALELALQSMSSTFKHKMEGS